MNGGVIEFRCLNLQRLSRLAELLHQRLPPQVVIGLRGTLGAGKTRLAQAIAEASGVAPTEVTSPTFTLVQHYRGSRSIHHVDAYRLADEDEFIQLGGEELFEDEAMVLIEWPERIGDSLPSNCLMLDIEIDDEAAEQEAVSAAEHAANQNHPDRATRTIRASSRDEGLMTIMHQIWQSLNEPEEPKDDAS